MMRTIVTVLGVVCAATLVTEGLALGLLWYRGQLNAESVAEITAILSGEEPGGTALADDEAPPPSTEEVANAIARERLELDTRDDEFRVLMKLVEDERRQLDEDLAVLESSKKKFEERLAELEKTLTSEGVDQARRILKAQRAEDAVAQLAPLEFEEAVILLRGLPDKTIAAILQQFAASNDEQQRRRGLEIFEALSRGEPKRSVVDQAAGTGTEDAGGTAPPPG